MEALARQCTGTNGTVKMWFARKTKEIQEVYDDRNKECGRLEAAEAKLLAKATKNVKKNKTPSGAKHSPNNHPIDAESADADAVISKYLSPKEKGKLTWKQGFLGLIGRKMDRRQSPAYIREKNNELEGMRDSVESIPLGNVAFVR